MLEKTKQDTIQGPKFPDQYEKLIEEKVKGLLECIQPVLHGDHVDLVPIFFDPKLKLGGNLSKGALQRLSSFDLT